DRAGSPVARGTRGRGQRKRDPGGLSPLCGSPSHRAGATDSNDAANGGDRRPARGARATRGRSPGAGRTAHGQRRPGRGPEASIGRTRRRALPRGRVRLGLRPARRPPGGGRGARDGPHRCALCRIGRDHRGGYAGRRGVRRADRRAQRRGGHRLLRCRRPARGRRGVRIRDPGRHGGRARRHLRVSRLSASPADELEVKARVDDPDGLRGALLRAGASLDFRGDMTDRRFDRDRTLAERGEVLRLREFRPADGAPAYGVLGWKGPASQRGMYRHRAEAEARVAAPDSVVTILEQLGFAVSLRIDRHVEVYRLGRAVLRLEWYPAMDVLLEVEGEPPDIELAIAATGLARERFLPESLPYFVAQYEARTGRAALLAR